jgi:hypothetical protein
MTGILEVMGRHEDGPMELTEDHFGHLQRAWFSR